MRRATRTIAILALTATFMGCNPPATPATTPTSATSVLTLYPTQSTRPLAVDLARAYDAEQQVVSVSTLPSQDTTAYSSIEANQSAYLMTLHLSPEYSDHAIPIAQDAILIIANSDVSDMTLEQLRAIYQGRVADWEQLDGDSQPIIAVSREGSSDIRQEFNRMVMGRSRTSASTRLVTSDAQMIEFVNRTDGAIGYISAGYRTDTAGVLHINGVSASVEAIIQGIYPLRTTVYAIRNPSSEQQNDLFLNWIQSIEGQQIVSQRYLPILSVHGDSR